MTGGCHGNCCRATRLHVAEPSHEATDEVWCFCPVSRTCRPAAAMLRPRTMHAALTCLHRLYLIGGRTRGPTGDAPSLLQAGITSVTPNLQVWTLCLLNLSFPVFQVDSYDPLTETWCSVSPLPTAIFYPEAAACGSLIYALGSEVELTETFSPLLDCFFCYDAQKDQWSRLVAEFAQFFHATLVKAVCNEDALHLCDLSTYKVSPAAREGSVLCLCFRDADQNAALPFRSTVFVQRPANGKVKGHLSVQGSMLEQWGRETESTSWVETIHLMRSPMMFRWAK